MSFLEAKWFSRINRPSRYLGYEINSIAKDLSHVEISVALAFPDVYEVGMSHLGLRILYHILNTRPWLAAERVFSPWVDLEAELRRRNLPLSTLESNRPLSEFDLVGFSLQHELSFTNTVNMLDLSGIPIRSRDREDSHPLVMAGGPACFNPEPVADIFDIIVVGDGEEACLDICRIARDARSQRVKNRKEILHQMRHIPGVYIPSFFTPHYTAEGRIHRVEPSDPDYAVVEKAIVPSIEQTPFPVNQIVPFTELVHDRLAVEIARGCTRGCRFCQAGMIYRPVREREPRSIMDYVERGLRSSGFEDVTLLSLSSGDYTCIGPLLKALMDRQSPNPAAVSLPSLRVDSFDPALMEQIKRVRKTGFTLAPEAGSDRLRRIINKGLGRTDILEMARSVYGAGWNLIKLYFMIGLPMEEESDLLEIIDLAKRIVRFAGKKGKRAKLNLSLSTFVPKSHTPFMWVPQISLEESRRRIQLIQKGLNTSPVRVKWNRPELSWLEGVFSRGDRRLCEVLVEAWRLGARYDAWDEHYRMKIWKDAFGRMRLDPDFYLYRERDLDEILPWDHVRSGIRKTYLKSEWKRAQEARLTPDCRDHCLECGVCDHKTVDPVIAGPWTDTSMDTKRSAPHRMRSSESYRLTFTKLGPARHLSHLELVRVFIRSFRRSGLELVHSRGFHPMPKVSFASALPVGTESMQETVDIEVSGAVDRETLKQRINRELPTGIDVKSVELLPRLGKKKHLKESQFLITLSGVRLKEEAVEKFLNSEYFPVVKVNKKGEKKINARPLVKSMDLVSPNGIKLAITHTASSGSRPAEIVKSVFSLEDVHLGDMRVVKIGQTLA